LVHLQQLLTGLIVSLGLTFAASAPMAGEPMPPLDEIVTVRIIPGWHTDDGHHVGALQVTLAPGWKTYWRAAGENGFPPVFRWGGSRNIDGVEMLWPRPDILMAGGTEILGFSHELILPIRFQAGEPGHEIHAKGVVELGVCREVCMPVQIPFSADLTPSDADTQFLIELALGDQPEQSASQNAACRLLAHEDGYTLEAELTLPRSAETREIAVMELALDGVWVSPSRLNRQGDRLVVSSDLVSFDGSPFKPDLSSLRLTIIDAARAIEVSGCSPAKVD